MSREWITRHALEVLVSCMSLSRNRCTLSGVMHYRFKKGDWDMTIEIEQFICRSDNFGVLVHETASGETAIIDAPDEAAILAAIERTGWHPTALLITHHHGDHVEANLALKKRYGLKITGPKAEAEKIPGIDEEVEEGRIIKLGGE